MGAKKQTKGRGGGRQRRQAPPSGTTVAGIASAAGGKPPLRFPQWQVEQVPPGFSPPAGFMFEKVCKCRRRFIAGVPGAKPPAK